MKDSDIIEQFRKIKTISDLASLLEEIKQGKPEFHLLRYTVTEKMLRHFSSDRIAPRRFRTFRIRKKKKAEYREIKAPCEQLKVILTCLNALFKTIYEPSEAAMGFRAGRSVLNNAEAHVGNNYVFNIDLKDFFTSIPQARVWKRLQLPPFNFPQGVANVVAGLCCSFDEEAGVNVLPQGSPASPLLTNAICDKLDRRMRGVARRFGLHYSRYADDMTFSSMHNVYQEAGEFRREIERIITDQGFQLNPAKTRLQKRGGRQEVTGLTVNEVANVSRQYKIDLRWLLSLWEKEGYAKAYARFYTHYKEEKGYIKKGEPVMEHVIGGKLNYLRMVRGGSNPACRRLEERYAALQQFESPDTHTDRRRSFIYVQPYSMEKFQELFDTTVSLEISREHKVIGRCRIAGRERILSMSHAAQEELCPERGELLVGMPVESGLLKECFVTLCRRKDKNFWLITRKEPKRSYMLSVQGVRITPDELLEVWEMRGFEEAASELALFLQYGLPGESITDWNPLDEHRDQSIDRGPFMRGKEYLIRYFLKNKYLDYRQRARFLKLLQPVAKASVPTAGAERLLDIWEKEGLQAAVEAWKEMTAEEEERKKQMKQLKGEGHKAPKPGGVPKDFRPRLINF